MIQLKCPDCGTNLAFASEPKPEPTPLPPLRRLQPEYEWGHWDWVADVIIKGGLAVLVALPVLLILKGLGVL